MIDGTKYRMTREEFLKKMTFVVKNPETGNVETAVVTRNVEKDGTRIEIDKRLCTFYNGKVASDVPIGRYSAKLMGSLLKNFDGDTCVGVQCSIKRHSPGMLENQRHYDVVRQPEPVMLTRAEVEEFKADPAALVGFPMERLVGIGDDK